MKTIALAVLLLYDIMCQAQCLDLDVVVLADFSGSVTGHEQTVVDAIDGFVAAFDLNRDGVNIGVVVFSDRATVVSPLDFDAAEILHQTNLLRGINASGGTDMTTGLQEAAQLLLSEGRAGYRRIVIVISDGDVDSPETAAAVVSQFQVLGIGVCSVLIRNDVSKPEFMRAISSGCYAEADFETLAAELKKLDLCL